MKSVDPGILSKSVCFTFTPSELAQKLYFYPTWCGHYYCNQNYFMKRNSYPPLLVAFVRNGFFHVEYRNISFEAGKGDVILLDCQEPHYYHAHDGLEFLYMHFDGSNSRQICQYILDNIGPLIQQDTNVLIGRELYNMVEFYAHDGIENSIKASMRIYRILEYLLTPNKIKVQDENPIEQTIHFIKNNIGKEIDLAQLASIAKMSPYYYAHLFKKQTGFSPIEYVINARIDRAKILLVHTKQPIAEIAYLLGYASSNSFINIFVKRIGMSPRQYRKLHQSLVKKKTSL